MEKTARTNRASAFFPTMRRLFTYFHGRTWLLFVVAILVIYSSLANILGMYFTKDILNYLVQAVPAAGEAPLSEASLSQALVLLSQKILPLALLYLAGIVANVLYMQIMVHLTQDVLYRVRADLFSKMQRLPIAYFDTHTHGEVMDYFTNDVDTIVNALNDSFANVFLSFSNIVGTLVCMFLLSWQLSLAVLPLILFLFVFLVVNTKKTRKYFRMQQDALGEVNSKVEEDIAGVKVEKAFNHEKASMDDFLVSNRKWEEASRNAFFHTQITIPVNVSVSYFNFAVSVVYGSYLLVEGSLLFGNLASFLVFVRTVCQPFNFFTLHINNLLTCAAGAERIFGFLDEKEEVDEGKVTLVRSEEPSSRIPGASFTSRYEWAIPQEDGTVRRQPLTGRIEFRHVSFSYTPGKKILQDISFTAYPGKKVAFVGSTGAGKTTIISLLARFYPIDYGTITYDGIDIEDISLESLRRAISMVTQETHLFTGTILDNIRYVRRHSSREEVIAASKLSHADSFIRRTPKGYDTMLYDDGANLSEGQRQLLGITRASLNQPPVMILDEATSNIDTQSEELIQQGLSKLMENKTVIEIAHRLSTIRDADEIIVLDHGVILERGTQEELLSHRGPYYDLYTGKKELA